MTLCIHCFPFKNYFVVLEEGDNPFKITCKCRNDIVTCSDRSGELLYINCLHYGMYTIGLCPEELVPESFTFSGLPE